MWVKRMSEQWQVWLAAAAFFLFTALATQARGGEKETVPCPHEVLLKLHNEARVRAGAKPLMYSPIDAEWARKHSVNQAAQCGKCYHSWEVMNSNLQEWSENVMWGSNGKVWTQTDAHDSWMESPGHKRNLLDSKWTKVGFGMAVGKNGTYWTAVFMR